MNGVYSAVLWTAGAGRKGGRKENQDCITRNMDSSVGKVSRRSGRNIAIAIMTRYQDQLWMQSFVPRVS